jgi:hypothetical protein
MARQGGMGWRRAVCGPRPVLTWWSPGRGAGAPPASAMSNPGTRVAPGAWSHSAHERSLVLDCMVSVTASKYLLARGRVWESDSSQPCEAAGQKAGTATQLTVSDETHDGEEEQQRVRGARVHACASEERLLDHQHEQGVVQGAGAASSYLSRSCRRSRSTCSPRLTAVGALRAAVVVKSSWP